MAYMESLDDEVQSPLGKPSNSRFEYWGVPPFVAKNVAREVSFPGGGGEVGH
jgi:hypothetical protein